LPNAILIFTKGYIITSQLQSHRRLLRLAFPLILANVTTPLLGLVDTAILGRMDEVYYLAGASIGALIITQIYWVCGFMKMSITGLSAEAASKPTDADNRQNIVGPLRLLAQGCFIACLLAFALLLAKPLILHLGLVFSQAEPSVSNSITRYFSIRIWGAPAALINMVMIGWLIGQQKTKTVLVLQVIINLANIILSLLFVFAFNWEIEGVAAATVCAEYLMLFCALWMVWRWATGQSNHLLLQKRELITWFSLERLKPLLHLNSHMLVRNLALQFTLAFVTLKGAQYGAQAAAINAIILQFFTLIALGLDGIANAVEALVGEAKGQQSIPKLKRQVSTGLFWSSALAILYTIGFYYLDSPIINLLTHHESIIEGMQSYAFVVLLMPFIAHWCFLFDGVFVGLSKGKPMRNSMIVSTVGVFLPVWWLFAGLGNMALWIAMLSFLMSRGVLLGAYYWYVMNRNEQRFLV